MSHCFNPLDYTPQRFGLSYNPPAIIVEYMRPSIEKLYHHKIKFSHFSSMMTLEEIIEEIYKKHQDYLMHQRVDKEQITQLVKKLREKYDLSQAQNNKTSIKTSHNENKQKMHNDSLNDLRETKENNNSNNDSSNIVNKSYVRKYSYDTNEDMNKLSKEELDLKKKEMDLLYEEHHINKDFNNEEYDAEWDEDDDE